MSCSRSHSELEAPGIKIQDQNCFPGEYVSLFSSSFKFFFSFFFSEVSRLWIINKSIVLHTRSPKGNSVQDASAFTMQLKCRTFPETDVTELGLLTQIPARLRQLWVQTITQTKDCRTKGPRRQEVTPRGPLGNSKEREKKNVSGWKAGVASACKGSPLILEKRQSRNPGCCQFASCYLNSAYWAFNEMSATCWAWG